MNKNKGYVLPVVLILLLIVLAGISLFVLDTTPSISSGTSDRVENNLPATTSSQTNDEQVNTVDEDVSTTSGDVVESDDIEENATTSDSE